ncbi:FKBP-type peptidyl-prolyl cis-trans isomerase [Candidatus Saccharibacteria bacterium]|nr:FKBP-type peptidyl-prolyl cis-trans isomerase [Candidatus Saccharibacteria bacterium]
MLKAVKLGSLYLGAGAVIGLSVVGWLYAHRLDGSGAMASLRPTAYQTSDALAPDGSASNKSTAPVLRVAQTDAGSAQGATYGGSQAAAATPTPNTPAESLPGPSDFKQYDAYKSDATHVYSVDIQKGSGTAVALNDKVVVRYTGWLTDGTVFDSTEKPGGKPVEFQLSQGQLISGWVTGLQGMQVGERDA